MRTATSIIIGNDSAFSQKVREVVDSLQNSRSELHPHLSADKVSSLLRPDVKLVVLHHQSVTESVKVRSLLNAIRATSRLPIIVLCEEKRKNRMLEWVKLGADDCLSQPVDWAHLALLIDTLTFHARFGGRDENWLTAPGVERFCVAAPEMFKLARQIPRVAAGSANTLITGETGTGKTHLAHFIHALSGRARKPFLAVNCAAIPEMLIESEFFGHQRGAFTGAEKDRAGVFSQVGGGTLFLDEVDALPPASQAKLLHVVEGRGFSPIGSNSPKSHEFKGRLIFATNRDLPSLVQARIFRSDLYYRLAVLELHLPPLRARRLEVGLLAEDFIRAASNRDGCHGKTLSPGALTVLEAYDWPGNVRELHNVLSRALTFSLGEEIQAADLPDTVCGRAALQCGSLPADSRPEGTTGHFSLPTTTHFAKAGLPQLEQARNAGEIRELSKVLAANANNRTKTAMQLGISRSALYKRLQKLGLSAES